jgi:hypothetical protein
MPGLNKQLQNVEGKKGTFTVSWWIRILRCIEEVPQVHFSIQCKFKLEFFNWFQLEFKLRIAVET